MVEIEIFTPTGVLAGVTERIPLSADGPDLLAPLVLEDCRWYPIDGSPPSHHGNDCVAPDDILIFVSPEPDFLVHMVWYTVALDVGPYRVTGSLATHPGFDPDRAIARPTNGFVSLRDATIELPEQGDAAVAKRHNVQINRYAVERVSSKLMLGFYFPGARLVEQEPATVA